MVVSQRHIFEDPAGGGSSGNAASCPPQVDPWTGKTFEPVNQHTPEPAPWLSTSGQFDATQQAKLNAIESESRAASKESQRINADQGAGGLALNFGSGDTSPGAAVDDYDAQSLRRFGEVNPGDHGSGGIAIGGQ